jgi:hypothetical protein
VFARASIWLLPIVLAARLVAAQGPAGQDPSAAGDEIDALLRQATSPQVEPARRDALLAEAARRMQERLQDVLAQAPSQPAEVLARLSLELKLAETEALLRGEPYAARLLHLQGSTADRRRLEELTAGALKRLQNLSREIDGKLAVWKGEYRKLVTAVPALENLQASAAYKTAWVALYRAMALDSGDERSDLLDEAAALARPFAEVSAEPGEAAPAEAQDTSARPWSLLLIGIARRERGQHEQAAASLQEACNFPDPAVRTEALFQAAQNLIEHGLQLSRSGQAEAAKQRWQAAQDAIETFAAFAAKARGAKASATDELNKAFLTHYLYQTMAQAAGARRGQEQQEQLEQLEKKAQAALADFVVLHPEEAVQPQFLQIVAEKYRSVKDRDDLSPVVLLALAVAGRQGSSSAPATGEADFDKLASAELSSSPSLRAEGSVEASRTDSAEMLRKVLAGSDKVSLALRPAVLWHLATLEAARGQTRRAAELFAELASRYGESSFARPAALNAVVCYNNLLILLDEDEKKGPAAEVEGIRSGFLAALETLLARWGRQADVAGWYFDLGWQYEKLSEIAATASAEAMRDKALAAYQAVPVSDPRHVQALRRALGIRVRRLLEGPGDDPSRPKRAAELVEALRDCAAKAKAAGTEKDMVDAGAWAELTAVKILLDVPNRRDEAMALLTGLPARWPGSDVLVEGVELQALMLLEEGQVDQAVAAVEVVGKDRPAQALRLGRRLLEQMRRRGGSTESASRPWVEGRLHLAEYLYRRCGDAEGQDIALVRHAYAQALLQAGRAAEALELLLQCRKQAQEDAARQCSEIDAEVAKKLSAISAARGDVARLRAMAAEFLQTPDVAGLKSQAGRSGWAVRGALGALDGAISSDQQQRLLEQLASALEAGYRQLGMAKKQALAGSGELLEDLARAYGDLGRFEQAAQIYGQLIEGLDAAQAPSAYWNAELGYCRCILAARGRDKRAMKSLAVRIAQLKQQDPAMGNLAEQFAAIQSQAAQAGE